MGLTTLIVTTFNNFRFRKKIKNMTTEGFEPSPPKR